jgi:methionyl-tRNA formyltransferase
MIENKLGRSPDLICLAGYDQWLSDWLVDRYYPRMLNVHPGDTTRGYDGLHWIPSAKAILSGEEAIRSTLFIVDKGEDTGPVLVQSAPLNIKSTLAKLEKDGNSGLLDGLATIKKFAKGNNVRTYEEFSARVDKELAGVMERICSLLQNELKVAGDWEIFPFAVHDLVARGRVALEGRQVYVDGKAMPVYGYRLDEAGE